MPFFQPTLIEIATLLYTVPKNCNCKWLFLKFTGPKLPMELVRHAMVQLGNGLAIIGGFGNGNIQAKIHLLHCMNINCAISTLNQELPVPRQMFLAIPIPDTIAGCISGGKKCQKRCLIFFYSKVRSENKYTKHSSVSLLRLVYLFSERTLKRCVSLLNFEDLLKVS